MVAAGDASKGFDLQKLNKFSKSEILDPLVQEEKNLAAQLREGLSKLLDMHNPAELGSLCGAMGLVEECEFGTHAEKKAGVLRKVAQTGARYNSTERAHTECLETMWDGILYEVCVSKFNLGSLAVGVGCYSLDTVEGISRRSCPSLGLSEGRGAEIATT